MAKEIIGFIVIVVLAGVICACQVALVGIGSTLVAHGVRLNFGLMTFLVIAIATLTFALVAVAWIKLRIASKRRE